MRILSSRIANSYSNADPDHIRQLLMKKGEIINYVYICA